MVHLADLESLACLGRLVDKVPLEQQECLEQRDLMVQEGHLEAEALLELRECLV